MRLTGETSGSVAPAAAGPAGQLLEAERARPDYARRIAEALEQGVVVLRGIEAALAQMVVARIEQATADLTPGTPLPEDFPGREVLLEQGVIYLESVPRTGEALAQLGLGPREINRIISRMRSGV